MLHLKHFTAEEKQNSLASRSIDILPQRARRSRRKTIIGLRTKATYCQGQRRLTAEGAEDAEKGIIHGLGKYKKGFFAFFARG